MTSRCIIILGYTLTKDGNIQPILKTRLDKALAIYQPSDMLLVCGKDAPKSMGSERCEHITEAEAMKQYLVEHGVPSKNILKEERSATTFGNALFSYILIKESVEHFSPIFVISNEFHEPLVKYCFDKVFGDHYPYIFSAVPDRTLEATADEIRSWKSTNIKLVEECYPLLFSKIENGDIDAIQSRISSSDRTIFETKLRILLHLDESIDIAIASEEEHFTSKTELTK